MLPSWVETWLCTWLIMTLHFLGTVTSPLVRSTLSRERPTANHLWCLQIVFCLDVQRLVGPIPLAGWNFAAFSTLRRRACHEALWWQRSFATGKTCASLLNDFECFVKAECAAPFEVGTLSWTAGRGLRCASRWARCGKATHTADAKMQRVFCFIRELLKQRPSLFTCPADFVPAQVQHLDDLMLAMMGAADLGGCTLIHLVVFPLFKSATFCVDFVLILVLI